MIRNITAMTINGIELVRVRVPDDVCSSCVLDIYLKGECKKFCKDGYVWQMKEEAENDSMV